MIIFIRGEDIFRSLSYLNSVKAKFLREIDPHGANLRLIEGAECGLSDIAGAFGASSLFARKRMIIVRDIFQNKNEVIFEKILPFLREREIESDNILIFRDEKIGGVLTKNKKELIKFLSGQKYSPTEFKFLDLPAVKKWILKEITARGGQIGVRALEYLSSAVGSDLARANSEIEKLVAFKLGGVINEADVKILVEKNAVDNIFAMTDAFASGGAPALLLLNEQVDAGSDIFQILAMLVRHFKILAQVKSASESGLTQPQIVSELKLHPFVVKKSIDHARRFNLEKLKVIFTELGVIDYKSKSSSFDAHAGLEILAVKLGVAGKN